MLLFGVASTDANQSPRSCIDRKQIAIILAAKYRELIVKLSPKLFILL